MITEALVRKALATIQSSPANHEYFFANLNSPDWIEPLRKARRFKQPAKIRREGETLSFPTWPESGYLSRMAVAVPELVRDVIVEADATDNERVHQDYVIAASHMPAAAAADIAKLEIKWIQSRDYLYTIYSEKVGDLISHLVREGESDRALELARALLRVIPDPSRDDPKADDEDAFLMPLEPMGRFDQWHYRRVLERNVPDLSKARPREAARLLSDLLDAAVRIHSARNETPDEDYSWIWRPNIGHEHHHDFKEALIGAVRDAALAMCSTPDSVAEAMNILIARRWRVFRRIAAYVLDNSPVVNPNAIEQFLTTGWEYDDFPGSSPEFDDLLRKSFGSLKEQPREAILKIIDSGPNLAPFKERREREGKPATEEEVSELADLWRLKWLAQVTDSLPADWRERSETLVARLGEPPVTSRRGPSFSWVGPTSPKTPEELRELTPGELIDFLRKWQTAGDWNSPTPEGLGRALSDMLSNNPEGLAAQADLLRGLDPTYVRSAIDGFREALNKGKIVAWGPILDLCEWVVALPPVIPGRDGSLGERDPDWGWTRNAIARLIQEGLHDRASALPIEYRVRIWEIIRAISEDPDPSNGRADPYGKRTFVGSASLNVGRGIAMEAIVDYGLWIRRQLLPNLAKETGALSEMPEVRVALEEHVASDSSPAVREVYGRRFPWLVVLDRQWAASKVKEIFEHSDELLSRIAWANYVVFNRPYDDVVPLLTEQYGRAIERATKTAKDELYDADRHLAEHLMVVYWRGKLPLDDKNGLLRRFFKQAPDKLRAHAIWFVGRTLYVDKSEIPASTAKLLMGLWEWRFSITQQVKGDQEPIQFGYWFAAGKLDADWAMSNLLDLLRVSHRAEPDHLVVERLASVADAMPTEAVRGLGLLIEADREGWSIYGWQEHPRQILSIALGSGKPEARAEAQRVIHLLGSRGHHGYRDLLRAS